VCCTLSIAMRWTLTHGDILDVPADVLVCSANVWLNLSGGVGGAIPLRHGDAMQRELHRWLADHGRRHAEPGTVVATGPHGLPVAAVLHAVAVDGFYESSPERVRGCITTSLQMAGHLGAIRVALTALATGFGRMSLADFAAAVVPLRSASCPPIAPGIGAPLRTKSVCGAGGCRARGGEMPDDLQVHAGRVTLWIDHQSRAKL
jgi:O-acetyl-ADP-ribose deacetylase (regulator of RNase III)